MFQTKKLGLNKVNIFLFLIVLTLTFVIAQTAITMTGSSIKVIKNSTDVKFPIYLDNNESIMGFQVEINYSTNFLELTDVELTSRAPSAQIVFNDQSPIVKIAVLVNNESNKIASGSDAILNLIFDVEEDASAGNYTIDLSELISTNISTIVLESSEIDGNLEITEPYNFTFLQPITNFENFTLQEGATLPLKFNVTFENNFISDNSVLVRIHNETLGIDHTYNSSDINIDSVSEKYQINIHTGANGLDMSEGIYDIEVTFNNYQKEVIGFELVDKSQGIGKGKQK